MPKVKVVTYNIRNARGTDNQVDLMRIFGLLKKINADIIFLQECDKNRRQSGRTHQAHKLAKRLNMNYVYGAVNRYVLASAGNAVLTRYPIVGHCNHPLPQTNDPRCCLQVSMKVGRQLYTVFNVHLGLNHRLRMLGLQETILPMIISCQSPVILAGDLNASQDSPEVRLLSTYLHDTFAENICPQQNTFPAHEPRERLDYIFINDACCSIKSYILESQASDHLPVIAEISS
jgi:endonuclease/exonuclease/phosphatase family metal-dependent hydrolase